MTTEGFFEIVSALERKVWNAVVERDGAALGALFADDYIEITPDGERIEKNEIVELSPKVDEIDHYGIDSERFITLGDNTVVLSYHLILDGRNQGRTISPRERWATSIWSRIDGCWLCRLFQQTHYRQEEALRRIP